MPDHVSTDGLADDIVDNLPKLKPNSGAIADAKAATEKALAELVDACVEDADAMFADAIDTAVAKALAARPETTLLDLADLSDVSGREIGAMISEGDSLNRQTFLRGFLDGLSNMALDDLHSELLRR